MTTIPTPSGPPCAPGHSGPAPRPGCAPDTEGQGPADAARQIAYDAVFAYIRQLGDVMPGDKVERNVLIWHAIQAALDARQAPAAPAAPAYPGDPLPGALALLDGVRAWLANRGLNPDSPDLRDTPHRVLRALNEMTVGYEQDPAEHLARTFTVDHDGSPIVVTGVPFTSLCAHHLLPFAGTADIAYQPRPGAPVAGLSKLPRVLDVYARRLQTQEELTQQVTAALDQHLDTTGSACIIRSEHGCLAHRGARKPGTRMVTASYTGTFRDSPRARADLHLLMST